MTDTFEKIFSELGGTFLTKPQTISEKAKNLQGILLDWDGVFNSGVKSAAHPSTYSEVDSMGINMLRFSVWLQTGQVPFTGIITGQINDSAFELAKREHFHSVYFNFKSKKEALDHIQNTYQIKPSKLVFVFDDILDIAAAKFSGLNMLINRTASPLFTQYVKNNKLADYITAHGSNNNAIREICELIMACTGTYENVLENRIGYTDIYQEYLSTRNLINAKFYHKVDRKIIETVI